MSDASRYHKLLSYFKGSSRVKVQESFPCPYETNNAEYCY
jgi:hypothetical protein